MALPIVRAYICTLFNLILIPLLPFSLLSPLDSAPRPRTFCSRPPHYKTERLPLHDSRKEPCHSQSPNLATAYRTHH
ncbi:hypothetical protein BKA64DRAFT_206943 [Cadophora sp. MPI-SDFR-AT-0126]|nr:hypothetical protein BKA64DRAFT_206943 [Leotiomycetes sp. MPI-SDFR-AT-0126]